MLEDAIQAIRMGNRDEGRQILEEMLEADDSNEDIWLLLSIVVDSDEDREVCLENALALNPDNAVAKKAQQGIKSGSFNAQAIMEQYLAEDEEPEEETEEEAALEEDEEEEDEDEDEPAPKKKGKDKEKAKGKGKKKGAASGGPAALLKDRRVVMGLVAAVIILALVCMAVSRTFLSGGETESTVTPPEGQPTVEGQQPPVEGQPAVTNTATLVPTATLTPTETLTPTPQFQLPTVPPTAPPTPTNTPVVPPTPRGR